MKIYSPKANLFTATAAARIQFSASTLSVQRRCLASLGNDPLFKQLAETAESRRAEVKNLKKEHGDRKIQDVCISNVLSGMRGITGLVCDTSIVDPSTGITFHGKTLKDTLAQLPKTRGTETSPEALFYFLLTKEIPSSAEVDHLSQQIIARSQLPEYALRILDNLKNAHPMVQLISTVAALSSESRFKNGYAGLPKQDRWQLAYEDALSLLGKVTMVAQKIYQNLSQSNQPTAVGSESDCDRPADVSQLLLHGTDMRQSNIAEAYIRLFLTIHADHEGGNISSHASLLCGSALSDPFLSCSAALSGLAGPLHGRANQDVLDFIDGLLSEIPEPSDEQIRHYLRSVLESGGVVPGFGHAVLRIADPRCTSHLEFASENLAQEAQKPGTALNTAMKLIKHAPEIMSGFDKIKNPNPNIDSISGSILREIGFKDQSYYTVLFGLSRAFGCMANYVLNHILGYPLERPKSITISGLKKLCNQQ